MLVQICPNLFLDPSRVEAIWEDKANKTVKAYMASGEQWTLSNRSLKEIIEKLESKGVEIAKMGDRFDEV